MIGQRVGHYHILEQIGSGGMGEVFRARDERLERDVALKLIRPDSSGNADHIRRFEQEARAAAALNHPNIVAIYDVGFDQGLHYIVSELLEGQTLRQRLDAGPLSPKQTTDYGLQAVQGLIAAHDQRIVHRDLKPENIFLTREGRIKILDFGVAKRQPLSGDGADSFQNMPTVTKSGSVIGTVAYMSPEQLRGKAVDHRSDIFAVGAILYEMVSGRRAFAGETEVDTMTAVLREDPPEIDLEKASIPPAFQEIARHCLEKEPQNRFQSARDLAFALQTLSVSDESKAIRYTNKNRRATKLVPWAIAALVATAALLLLGRQLRSSAPPISYRRLTFEQGTVYSARFASDGQSIIYGAAWNGKPQQLYSTVGNSLLPQPINLTSADLLAISPTNELAVAIKGIHGAHLESENGILARTPMAGGSPREVLKDVSFADWDAKGEMAVVHHIEGQSRLEFPVGHVLYQSSGWIGNIRFSPQGDKIAFLNHPLLWDDRGSVEVIDLAGKVKALSPEQDADGLAWSPDEKEIWFTAAERGEARNLQAVDLSGRIRVVLDLPSSVTLQDISPDGHVLMSLDTIRMGMDAVIQGEREELDLSWHDWNIVKGISRDGQWVLFEDSSEAAGPNYAVAVRKLNGDLPIRLGEGAAGGLSPDGQWAISISGDKAQNVMLLPLEAGQPRKLETANLEHISNSGARFLTDGQSIILNANEPGHAARCYLVNLNGGQPRPLTPEGTAGEAVSPDGRYIVGFGTEGALALYPVGAGGAYRQIPYLDGELQPAGWSEDSSALYGYRKGELPSKIYRVEIATGKETSIQELRPTASAGVVRIAPVVVSPDGKHIVYSYLQTLSTLYLISGLR